MLPFYGAMVEQLLEHDGLCVLGEGLGLHKLLAACVRLHAAQGGGLVLLLSCLDWQKRALLQALAADGGEEAPAPPADVTADMSIAERLALYAAGGCLFVTTRILVVDLLTERLPPGAITGAARRGAQARAELLTARARLPLRAGLLIANAHRVTDTCGEAFAVRLLRGGGNGGAFVRAFSDRPGELVRGFSATEKVLKALLLRHLFLWPRFHMAVCAALEARPPEVVELVQPLSVRIRLIQEALLQVMLACLGELKRSRHVDAAELTLEAGLFRSFDRVLSRQLDPVWHAVPRRLRQAVRDLRTLRGVAQCLLRYDAVTFLRYLELLRAGESRDALWLFADAAHTVFEEAKRRVYVLRRPGSPGKRQRTDPANRRDLPHCSRSSSNSWLG